MDRATTDRAIELIRRIDVLETCLDAPRTRTELVERTSHSRTTTYRATVSLVETGLLEDARDGYRTTARGAALMAATTDYLAAIETLADLGPLFEVADDPALVRHAHLLGDATLTVADPTAPYRVVDRLVERFGDPVRSRGAITSATSAEAIGRATSARETVAPTELIVTSGVLESRRVLHGPLVDATAERDAITVLVTEDDAIPFTFVFDDEGVAVVGHDPMVGLPTVCVESQRPSARAWLESIYERCLDRAKPLSLA